MPVSLLTQGKPCLVVGGGRIAFRKVGHLLDAGARVTVVSPDVADEMGTLRDAGRIHHAARPFEPDDLEGVFLVFAATNDSAVNHAILEACRKRDVLCCAVVR